METELTINDLIPGEYYHLEDAGEIVFKYESNNGDVHRPTASYYLSTMGKESFKSKDNTTNENLTPWITKRNCRKATREEIMWLEACKSENRFINAENFIEREISWWINKDQNDLEFEDFYDDQEFEGYLNNIFCKGKVSIFEKKVYLCQDNVSGSHCRDLKGFRYSYVIQDSSLELQLKDSKYSTINVKELKIKSKMPIIEGSRPLIKVDDKYPRWLNKEQKDLVFSDFYQGQLFIGDIEENKDVIGKITIENNRVYLCQDRVMGNQCSDKQGYKHSYTIGSNRIITVNGEVGGINVEHLKIGANPLQEIVEKIPQNLRDVEYFINIIHLEDNADERLMMDNTEDLSFLGFSKKDKTPIFRVKNSLERNSDWNTQLTKKIKAIGGTIKMIHKSEILEYLELEEA